MLDDISTIMVVEDETLLLHAITKKLKLSNLNVVSCASGNQALDYLDSMDQMPDAIWLDYYLKDMNGLLFMKALKAHPKWANIPVIVVSNSAGPEKVKSMLALGAKKYLLKAEYRLDQIIEVVKSFIDQNRAENSVPSNDNYNSAAPLPAERPLPNRSNPSLANRPQVQDIRPRRLER